MKVNWQAISQSLIVALLLAVGGGLWQTYQQASRIPTLEAEIAGLRRTLDEIRLRSDSADERLSDQMSDMRVTLGILEGRTAREAAHHGERDAPAALEGR